MRPIALLPVVCSIVAVILGFLCLFAGSKPGFMEDYAIVTFNTTELGYQPSSVSSSSPTIASWLSSAIQTVTGGSAIANAIESEIENAGVPLVDTLAADLGISAWYQLHILTICQGTFSPNATAPGAQYNTTNCTHESATYNFDPITQISNELSEGPLHINPADLNWPDNIQSTINTLNTVLTAVFALYVVGICLSFFTLIFALLTFFLPNRPAILTPLLLSLLALLSFITLGVASGLVTAAMVEIVNTLNGSAADIGIAAYRGNNFLALTWGATGVMLVAVIGSFLECCCGRRTRGREWSERKI